MAAKLVLLVKFLYAAILLDLFTNSPNPGLGRVNVEQINEVTQTTRVGSLSPQWVGARIVDSISVEWR